VDEGDVLSAVSTDIDSYKMSKRQARVGTITAYLGLGDAAVGLYL
jgi:hypothetical protein